MSDHIRDATKMVSNTPRTEAEVNRQKCWSDDLITIDANFACQLERELNAANAKIKRMEEAGDKMEEWLIWSFGPQFKRHTTALSWIKSKESKS